MVSLSFYSNTFEAKSNRVEVDTILTDIGNGKYKKMIEELRSLINEKREDEYSLRKRRLPAVTFCGVFGERRSVECLLEYSGLLIFDVDHLSQEKIDQLKDQFIHDPLMYAMWVSPSNKGLKFLVLAKGNVVSHKLYFRTLSKHFENTYGIEIDKSGSDVTRLCYLSYDQDIRIKTTSLEIDITFINLKILELGVQEQPISLRKSKAFVNNVSSNHNRGKGKNLVGDRLIVKDILKYLTRHKKSITSDYEKWFKVGYAISNAFSLDVGMGYYLEFCRLDGTSFDEEASKKMLLYCYDKKIDGLVNFGTIIYLASEEGYEIERKFGKGVRL